MLVRRVPIQDPATGHVLDGAAFDSAGGRFAIHHCANDCPGIVVGMAGKTGTAVIHYSAAEALEIANALMYLAQKALG